MCIKEKPWSTRVVNWVLAAVIALALIEPAIKFAIVFGWIG